MAASQLREIVAEYTNFCYNTFVKKILANWQLILRLVILIVSLFLVLGGLYNLANYYKDRKVEKTPVTALIVKSPKNNDSQLLKYTFDNEVYYSNPVDKLLHSYGKLGDDVKIYVQSNRPKHVFLRNPPRGEAILGSILLGWGILLALIIWAERKILKLLGNNGKDV